MDIILAFIAQTMMIEVPLKGAEFVVPVCLMLFMEAIY